MRVCVCVCVVVVAGVDTVYGKNSSRVEWLAQGRDNGDAAALLCLSEMSVCFLCVRSLTRQLAQTYSDFSQYVEQPNALRLECVCVFFVC